MKNTFKFLFSAFAVMALLVACEKDENRVSLEGGTPPVLTASSTSAMVLTSANAANTAIRFNWTNPNYRFTTGPSSQDVNYTLEVDTAGRSFGSPKKQEISIAKDLSVSYTVKEFNAVFSRMELAENRPHAVEIRIKASLAGGAAPLYSNVLRMTVTPYLDVAVPVPTNGNLWITGNAVNSGWSNPLGNPYDVNQKFTRVSNTLYELTIAMPGGGAYKLLQDNGDWSTQYHKVTGTWESGSFEKRDADPGFDGPTGAGTYKITVNFRTGQYTVVKQ